MARGTTLGNLRAMVKAEIGAFANTNVQQDAEINQLLANEQLWLAAEYPWPFLEQRFDVSVAVAQQYASLPTQVSPGTPATESLALVMEVMPVVEVYYNSVYNPVLYGIGIQEYNMLNVQKGQYSDPIQRWRMATNVSETSQPNMFEVWPVPVTPQVVRFTGQRVLNELFQGTDAVDYIANTANYRASGQTARVYLDALTADLDDMLLVLFVAAKRLARNKAADANIKLQQAQQRYQMLKQNYPVRFVHRALDGSDRLSRPRIQGMRILVH